MHKTFPDMRSLICWSPIFSLDLKISTLAKNLDLAHKIVHILHILSDPLL